MSIRDIKKVSAIILLIGFLGGIIYVNLFAKEYMISTGIFSDYFLKEYDGNHIDINNYLWYVMKLRVLPIGLLAVAACTQFRRIAGALFIIWTGFAGGVLLTAAVLKMGLSGVILCIVGIIPHFICYAAVYLMLIMYLFSYPNTRWNRLKTISIILFLLLGIVSETYINPVLMDIYTNLL